MIRARLRLASLLDRVEARGRRVAEKWGWPQAWLHEFQAYRTEPRMLPEEFWVEYTLRRRAAQPALTTVATEAQARAFYQTSDYMLWRNLVHRRHTAWRRVLVTMPPVGPCALLEYGSAIAPVSAWVAPRRPRWRYTLLDLPSPHRDYGEWRLRQRGAKVEVVEALPCYESYAVITALDVLEHLADPLGVAHSLYRALPDGGLLHWNFVGNPRRNDLDLASEADQRATEQFLREALTLVWDDGTYRVSRR